MLIDTHQQIKHNRGDTVPFGAIHTMKQAGSLSDNEVFSRPEFNGAAPRCTHGFGAGSANPQGRRHNLFCVDIPSPTRCPIQADGGFQFNKERETMTKPTPASRCAVPNTTTMTPEARLRAAYALAKQVPDLPFGFSIQTDHGPIHIPHGPTAKRITALVEKMLRAELADAAKTTKQGGAAC
jgi:hypothetical protein